MKNHSLLIALALILAAHLVSVAYVSGTRHVAIGATYLAILLVAYLALLGPARKLKDMPSGVFAWRSENSLHALSTAISIAVVIFPFALLLMARRVPMLDMWLSEDYYASSNIRHDFYNNLPTYQKYFLDYYLRGVAPFWIVYTYLTRSKFFAPVLVASTFLAFVIVTKVSILILLLPLAVLLAVRRRWFQLTLTVVAILGLMAANVVIQSKDTFEQIVSAENLPNASTGQPEEGELLDYASVATYSAAEGILSRVLYVHGLVETQWLETYPEVRPFENGCGYRWLAGLLGCDFVNMPLEIWLHYYPDLEERGLRGSVTASDYVTAYANFGMAGVAVCAILMAILLHIVGSIYQSAALAISLNLAPLALSLESPISTLLNSGGWGLIMLLSLVFLTSRSDELPLYQVEEGRS